MRTTRNIYVTITGSIPLLVDYKCRGFILQIVSSYVIIVTTKVNHSQVQVTISGWPIMLKLSVSQRLCRIIWLSNLLTLNVPDEGYSRNASCALTEMSTLLQYLGHWIHYDVLHIHQTLGVVWWSLVCITVFKTAIASSRIIRILVIHKAVRCVIESSNIQIYFL